MSLAATRSSGRIVRWLGRASVVMVAALAGAMATSPSLARVAIAAGIALLLVTAVLHRLALGMYALVVWLATFASFRRITTGIATGFSLGDPLLLVGPAILGALMLVAIRRGAFRGRTRLTYAVMTLAGALTLSALNPSQGVLEVGLGGAVIVVVPMFAFFVGRTLVSDAVLRRVLGLYAGLAVLAAGYGLMQTFSGFPSWDQRWVTESGYAALNVNGVIRAFGSFASGAEYAGFLVVGAVCWLTLGFASRWRPFVLPAVALLTVAVWYESQRTAVVLLVLSIGSVVAARLGLPFWRSLLLGVVFVAALPWIVGRLAPASFGADTGSQLVAHQVSGLVDPFGKNSSLPGHIDIATEGITSAVREPLGRGVGSVTIAARKLGDGNSGGSVEADPGNAALAAGILGLGAYLLVLIEGIRRAYGRARRERAPLALAALGALFATLFQWLNGGQYAVVIVPWLVLGWSDRPARVADRELS